MSQALSEPYPNESDEYATAVKTYVLGCGCVASLMTRRAFGVVATECEWFQDSFGFQDSHGSIYESLQMLSIDARHANAVKDAAEAELLSVDEATWGRLIQICSFGFPRLIQTSDLGFTRGVREEIDEPWEAHRQELLELVCAAPYHTLARALTSSCSALLTASSARRWAAKSPMSPIGQQPSRGSC